METLCQDFFSTIEVEILLDFTQVEHCFVVAGQRGSLSLRCYVSATPRPGDTIDLSFVCGANGNTTYHVDSTLAKYKNREAHTKTLNFNLDNICIINTNVKYISVNNCLF